MLWRGSGEALAMLWRGSGEAPERPWPCSGEAPERFWPCTGEALERLRRGSGHARTVAAASEAGSVRHSTQASGRSRLILMYTCYYYYPENCVAASPLSSSSPGRIALAARAVWRVASCPMGNSAVPMGALQALAWGDLLGPIGAGWCVTPQHSQEVSSFRLCPSCVLLLPLLLLILYC